MCFYACDSLVYMQRSGSQPFAQCEDIFSVECLWFIVSASYPLSHVCSVNTAGAASGCVSECVCGFFFFFLSKSRTRSARGHKLMELMLICGRQAWHYTQAAPQFMRTLSTELTGSTQAPEEQDFPASQYVAHSNRQREVETVGVKRTGEKVGWREEMGKEDREEERELNEEKSARAESRRKRER